MADIENEGQSVEEQDLQWFYEMANIKIYKRRCSYLC